MSAGNAICAENNPADSGASCGTGALPVTVHGQDARATLLLVYGLYLAATVILTWPVAPRIGRDLPGGGPGDPQVYLWNIWWLKFSLFHLHQNPLWCSWIAWPFGASLALHTHTFLYGAAAILLSLLGINLAVSITLLFLNSFALMGLGTYLWCREFGAGRRGAFVGGFMAAFCIYRFGRGLCHYNLMATEFLPFFWLALKRGFESGRLQSYLWAAVFLLLTFWQDVQLFLLGGFFAAFYVASVAWANPKCLIRKATLKGVTAAAVVFLVGSLPYWLSVAPLMARGDYVVRDGSPATIADALSFFVPWPHHWLVGGWTNGLYERFHFPEIETAYIGYVALALAAIGFWTTRGQKRRIGWLAVAAVVFIVLSFGEDLQVAGQTQFRILGDVYSIVLPGTILKYIPGLRQLRVFSRFIFLAVFALAVPVALAADGLEQRLRNLRMKRFLVPALLALISIEVAPLPFMTHPFFLSNYAPFKLLEIIRNDPEMTTVFLVPPTINQPQEQYFQMFHGKPIYGGLLSRQPGYLTEHYRYMPAVGNFFWEREQYLKEAEAEIDLSPEFVERFIEFHNIKYLLLAPAPKYAALRRLVDARFPIAKQWYEKNFILYELERPAATERPLNIDLSRHWGFLYLGRSFWPPTEIGSWAVQPEAELRLPIRGKTWTTLVLEMTPFTYDKSPSQTAELFLNGHKLGSATLEPALSQYQFTIPAEALDDRPCSILRFRFGYCVSPIKLGLSKDRRTLAAAIRSLHVLAAPP